MTKAAADVRLVVEKLAEAMALGIDPAEALSPAPTTTPPEEQPAPLQHREEPERPPMPWDYQEEPDVVPAEKPMETAAAPAPQSELSRGAPTMLIVAPPPKEHPAPLYRHGESQRQPMPWDYKEEPDVEGAAS
jgi:hypothetical protein